jgi:hypothetical protein
VTDDIRLNSAKIARRCACKGWMIGIEAASADHGETVVKHQQSPEHSSWDVEGWVERNTAQVDVPIAVVRKVA